MTAPYLIAEVGSTHDGSLGNALRSIDVFANAGADCIKFQCHYGERRDEHPAGFENLTGESRQEYLDRTGFSADGWGKIRDRCDDQGVCLMVSPFSVAAVGFLAEHARPDSYKVASGQVTNLKMLRAMLHTAQPVYLSSGMTTWSELTVAWNILGRPLVMQCTSAYPCPDDLVGLNNLVEIRNRLGGPVGFSDHTLSDTASIAAVILGATVIERHVTLSKQGYGTDCAHSLSPEEFRTCRQVITAASRMLAPVDKDSFAEGATDMRRIFLE